MEVRSNVGFLKEMTDFLLVINCDFALARTVSDLYAIFGVFLHTGSDVTPISPLGGVTGKI